MQIGASTANLYPLLTETALEHLLSLGFRTTEVFLNTPSEAEPAFAEELRRRTDAAGASIVAVHPYFALGEPYFLFSLYERRFRDYLEQYRHLFDGAARMGASFLILHGDRAEHPALPAEGFAERYETLFDVGRSLGVTLLQENVVKFRAQSPAFVTQMRHLLGDKAQFVLDLKQCRRAGVSPLAMADAMGDGLRHLHLSDGTPEADCLVPGQGTEMFSALFSRLSQRGFNGSGIIELYRHNFSNESELWDGRQFLLTQL